MSKTELRLTAGIVLGIISVALTAWAVFWRVEVPFDAPEKLAYYRLTIGAIITAAALGTVAVVLGLRDGPADLRGGLLKTAVLVFGGGGLIEALFFLLVLTGLCGPAVLWGYCQG